MDDIKDMCRRIAAEIEMGRAREYCPTCGYLLQPHGDDEAYCADCECAVQPVMDGMDFIGDALDVEYIVNAKGEYLGARICVAFGGPTIWIDTRRRCVEGGWWADRASISYSADAMDIDGAASELWESR